MKLMEETKDKLRSRKREMCGCQSCETELIESNHSLPDGFKFFVSSILIAVFMFWLVNSCINTF